MTISRTAKVLLFSICFLLFGAAKVEACLCTPLTPKKRVKTMKKETAIVIFTGRVTSVATESGRAKVLLRTMDSWKGVDVDEVSVTTDQSGCGVYFEDGRSYLVYAAKDSAGILVTEVCFGSGLVEMSTADIKHLGKPVRRFLKPKL